MEATFIDPNEKSRFENWPDPENNPHIGFYFLSESCLERNFLVKIDKKDEGHGVATIYEIGCPQDGLIVKTGDLVCTYEVNQIAVLDVWGKYYFPAFNNDNNQWYHNYSGNSDWLKSTFDVVQYALQKTIEVCEITLY